MNFDFKDYKNRLIMYFEYDLNLSFKDNLMQSRKLKNAFLILTVIVISVVLLSFGIWKFSDGGSSDSESINIIQEEKSSETVMEEDTGYIIVDISGEVVNPMVIELPAGSRIQDAISGAGGLTKNADISTVNRAEKLEDGTKILIPSKNETSDGNISSSESSSGSASTNIKENNNRVNINKADSEELRTLDGVGPAMAERIITYRNENGSFKAIEDLKNVSGIGDKTFEKLKNNICV
ncbi:MAG: helix-hairpin-helix domain-containing protein [Eubacterium sp.]|nr:helix-hairpin-helix domain-containing protein [Eubacterium sp.]